LVSQSFQNHLLMKHLLIILLAFSFNLSAQDIASTTATSTWGVRTTEMKVVAPTLWGDCDYFQGCATYIVYKSSVDKNIYLLGFDEQDEEIMRLKVDDVNLNKQMTVCYVTYNGWTIRLYNKLD